MPSPNRREFLHAAGALAAGALAAPRLAKAPPKFRLGLVTYNVAANWDLPTILRICKATGVEAVELRTTHKHGVEPALSADARKAVRDRFADSRIVFWGCGSTCEFHSPDPAVVAKNVEECKRLVQLAADLGGKGVKVRPNDLPRGVEPAKTLEQIGKALIECGKAAADAGVEIWVEVHGKGTALPANMRALMDHCGHPSVGVTWNSNGTDLVDGSLEAGFDLLKPFIRSCHINDLENDAKGRLPYRRLFARLREIGYDRYTLCEVGKTYDPAQGEAFLRDYRKQWDELTAG